MNQRLSSIVHLITLNMHGHAKASGYDRLADYLNYPAIEQVQDWTLTRRVVARAFRFLIKRSGSVWYHRDSFLTELHAAKEWLKNHGHVFHFLYGENCYRYLGALKPLRPRNRIVCTYHLPPDIFRANVQDRRHLDRLDAIITMSTVQNEFFSKFVGDRVFFIPHGVDIDYFHPDPVTTGPKQEVRCLFVGSYLRDLETLARTAEYVGQCRNDVRFVVVTRPELHRHFQGLRNVDLHAGVPDEQLLQMYHAADIFVLPLKDCTANNGLLEAMACGLPIVATDLQGVRDYTNAACALLTPIGDAEAMGEVVMNLAANQTQRKRMAQASRQQAMEFRWEKVAEQVREVYRTVAG